MDSLTVLADPVGIRDASVWLEQILANQGVPDEFRSRLDLCFNEVMANILYHGGDSAMKEPVDLQVAVQTFPDTGQATVTVSDTGVPFDPVSALPALRPQSLIEAEPGGLGLVMLHKLTDELHYCFAEGRNRLSFAVRWQNTE